MDAGIISNPGHVILITSFGPRTISLPSVTIFNTVCISPIFPNSSTETWWKPFLVSVSYIHTSILFHHLQKRGNSCNTVNIIYKCPPPLNVFQFDRSTCCRGGPQGSKPQPPNHIIRAPVKTGSWQAKTSPQISKQFHTINSSFASLNNCQENLGPRYL